MKLIKKSEIFEFDTPIGEPEYDWKKYNSRGQKYEIERIVNSKEETIWFGLNTNWLKKKGEEWTVLTINENAKPLEKYLPDIVYGEDRNYFAPCKIPIYEKMYLINYDENVKLMINSLMILGHSQEHAEKYTIENFDYFF